MLGWSFFSTVQGVNTCVGWETAEEERTLRNCAAEVNIVEVHAYLVGEPPRACMRMRCVSVRHEEVIFAGERTGDEDRAGLQVQLAVGTLDHKREVFLNAVSGPGVSEVCVRRGRGHVQKRRDGHGVSLV